MCELIGCASNRKYCSELTYELHDFVLKLTDGNVFIKTRVLLITVFDMNDQTLSKRKKWTVYVTRVYSSGIWAWHSKVLMNCLNGPSKSIRVIYFISIFNHSKK